MRSGIKASIQSGVIFGAEVGFVAYMVGQMETLRFSDTLPAQHPIITGVLVGVLTLMIGLLFVIALNSPASSKAR